MAPHVPYRVTSPDIILSAINFKLPRPYLRHPEMSMLEVLQSGALSPYWHLRASNGPTNLQEKGQKGKSLQGILFYLFLHKLGSYCGTPQLTAAESQPSSAQITGEGALEAGRSMLANRKPVSFWTQNGIPIWGMISLRTLTSGLQTFDLQTSPKRRAPITFYARTGEAGVNKKSVI